MRRFSLKLGLATLALLLANTVQAATVDKLSCINNKSNGKKYTTTNGDKYSIVCSIDYVGGDIATTKGLSFEQCIEGQLSCPTPPIYIVLIQNSVPGRQKLRRCFLCALWRLLLHKEQP
jgi:hypothetical protein